MPWSFQHVVKSRIAAAVQSRCTNHSMPQRCSRWLRGQNLLRCLLRTGGLLALACASCAWAADSPLDARAIIDRSVQANAADWKAAPDYNYFERDQQPDGGTKTYQVLMIEGSPYQRLVAVNGQPISQEQQAQEQEKLNATISARRNESPEAKAKRVQQYQKERERDQQLMKQLSEAFDFKLNGEQKLDGYDVYVMVATPRAGYQPPNMETKVLTGMQGELWIDKKTFQWVKVQAEVIHPVSIVGFLARVEPGTRFELEKRPVADGVWLAKHFSMKAHAKILNVFNHKEHADETYYQYQRASTPSPSTGGAAGRGHN